jgi:hypothetical protein
MQSLIVEELGVYIDLDVPIKTLAYLYSKARNKKEARLNPR